MSKSTTVEKNDRFYKRENGEIFTENQLLKEWLECANKQIEQLENIRKEAIEILNELRLLPPMEYGREEQIDNLLNILNKGDNNEKK